MEMQNKTSSAHLTVLAIIITATLYLSTAQADLVFSNGVPGSQTAGWMTHWLRAEDFTLAESTVLTDVRFWVKKDNFLDDFTWIIYADEPVPDNYGHSIHWPDAEISSGTAALTTTLYEYTWTVNSIDLYNATGFQVDFSLDPLALDAGTYWLALHNGPLTVTEEPSGSDDSWNGPSWLYTTTSTIPGSRLDEAPFDGDWAANGANLAFEVYGDPPVVPVPGAALLASIGLGFAGWLGRRKRA